MSAKLDIRHLCIMLICHNYFIRKDLSTKATSRKLQMYVSVYPKNRPNYFIEIRYMNLSRFI
jgi:hypothetical protein